MGGIFFILDPPPPTGRVEHSQSLESAGVGVVVRWWWWIGWRHGASGGDRVAQPPTKYILDPHPPRKFSPFSHIRKKFPITSTKFPIIRQIPKQVQLHPLY